MGPEPPDIGKLILNLMHFKTERDLQTKVGASNFSQSCARCLAEELLGQREEVDSPYWAGAWVGTAIHERFETLIRKHHPDWLSEQKLILGEIPGYGVIKSTTDLYIPNTAIDFKTTTKDKLKFIKGALKTEYDEYEVTKITEARSKVSGYVRQVMSYGRGLIMAGQEVEWVSLVFVCRDAVGDADIWAWTAPYDPELAEHTWDRLTRLWAWLQEGNSPDDLTSDSQCYYCSHSR